MLAISATKKKFEGIPGTRMYALKYLRGRLDKRMVNANYFRNKRLPANQKDMLNILTKREFSPGRAKAKKCNRLWLDIGDGRAALMRQEDAGLGKAARRKMLARSSDEKMRIVKRPTKLEELGEVVQFEDYEVLLVPKISDDVLDMVLAAAGQTTNVWKVPGFGRDHGFLVSVGPASLLEAFNYSMSLGLDLLPYEVALRLARKYAGFYSNIGVRKLDVKSQEGNGRCGGTIWLDPNGTCIDSASVLARGILK